MESNALSCGTEKVCGFSLISIVYKKSVIANISTWYPTVQVNYQWQIKNHTPVVLIKYTLYLFEIFREYMFAISRHGNRGVGLIVIWTTTTHHWYVHVLTHLDHGSRHFFLTMLFRSVSVLYRLYTLLFCQ